MHLPGGINLNINTGTQGLQQSHGGFGARGPRGAGPMMRMMHMMMRMMEQMMGGGQQGGRCCCPHHRPSFGTGRPPFQGGAQFSMGASISGFLG